MIAPFSQAGSTAVADNNINGGADRGSDVAAEPAADAPAERQPLRADGPAPAAPRDGLGLYELGDGKIGIRQPVNHELNLPPGQDGAGLFDTALAWVGDDTADDAATFGGFDPADWREQRLHPIPLNGGAGAPGIWWAVEYRQALNGRRVEDTYLQLGVVDRVSNARLEAVLVLAQGWPELPAMEPSRFSLQQCRELAAAMLLMDVADIVITSEERTVRMIDGRAVPHTHVVVDAAETDFIVDETDGTVVAESTLTHATVTVQATVEHINHDPNTLTPNTPLKSVTVDYGSGTAVTDANGQAPVPNNVTSTVTLAGPNCHIVRSDGGALQSGSVLGTGTVNFSNTSEFTLAANDAFYHVVAIYDYLQQRVDTGVNNSPFDTHSLETQVNRSGSCNAFFSGAPRIMFLRQSSSCRNTSMSDVIYHEYGHYVDWRMGGLFGGGGLGEGWADTVAVYMHGDPELGEGFFINDDPVNGNGLRSARNNYQWNPNDPIHRAGTAWSGTCWDMRECFLDAEANNSWTSNTPALQKAEENTFGALDANTQTVPDSVTFIDTFDMQNGGDAVSRTCIATAATNHGLDAYLAPRVYSVAPDPVGRLETLTITGSALAATSDVKIGGTPATILSRSVAQVEVAVGLQTPLGPGQVVEVTTQTGVDSSQTVEVDPVPVPSVTSVAPDPVLQLAPMTIAGDNLDRNPSVTIGGVSAQISSATKTQLDIVLSAYTPVGAGQVVEVTTLFGVDNTHSVTVIGLVPGVTSVSPDPVQWLQTLTINGSELAYTTGVTVGGVAVPIYYKTSAQVVVAIPDTAPVGPGQTVEVTTPGGMDNSVSVQVDGAPPTVGFATPTAIRWLASLRLGGTALRGTTDVTIGGVAATITSATSTNVTLVVSDSTPLGSQTVELTTPFGSDTTTVTVRGIAPTITGVSPDPVKASTVLTITGTALAGVFDAGVGTTLAKFGGNTANEVQITIPADIAPGPRQTVWLVTPFGTASAVVDILPPPSCCGMVSSRDPATNDTTLWLLLLALVPLAVVGTRRLHA